jgi:methyltransferase family protein
VPRESSRLQGRSRFSVRTAALIRHPFETWDRLRGRVEIAREPPPPRYVADDRWEARLHECFGVPWPCASADVFSRIWANLSSELAEFGVGHDADSGLAQAIFCTASHTAPHRMIEIGVARGISTRFELEAIALNGFGSLWSIDLPPLLEGWRGQVAQAVPSSLRGPWTYIRGSARRRLPRLLSRVGSIDLFVHDGLHTTPSVLRELELAWTFLRPGGFMIVDDVDRNQAVRLFSSRTTTDVLLIGQSERRGGFFAVVRKPS